MKMTVNLSDKSYDIVIEDGILNRISSFLNVKGKCFIVTDDFVPNEYLKTLLKELASSDYLVLKHGERSKNIKNYEKIISMLLEKGYSRSDTLVALGGGVIGDLSGFVAATYKRGMHFINIPTTMLSMVDSSIGGKVAIDYDNIKNSIGAFYQPDIVIIDPTVLKTLPKRQLMNGMVEALKSGMIGDESLYNMFKDGTYLKDIHSVIYKSLDVKRKVVEADEKELSVRKILNFGHTFGHAYESYFGLRKFLHGEAVAHGILTVSKDKEYYEEVKEIIKKMGIKELPSYDENDVFKYILNDKKTNNGYVDVLIVEKIGSCNIVKMNLKSLRKYL